MRWTHPEMHNNRQGSMVGPWRWTNSAGVMSGQSGFQIMGKPNIVLLRIPMAALQVNIVHVYLCDICPPSPSLRRAAFAPIVG